MIKPIKIPIKLKRINLRNRYWQNQDYHLRDYLHTVRYQMQIDINKSFRRELFRKLIHLSSLWIPLTIYFIPEQIAIALFTIIFIGDGLLEYGNFKKWKWVRFIFGRFFSYTLRSKETTHKNFKVSGSMYVMAAAILCSILFSKIIAIISMTVMLVSDTCSALFGKAYGTRQIYPHKSLEGTTAFFVSALLINMLFHQLEPFSYANVIACVFATLAEVYEDKIGIDDNLSIPLAIGITLTLLN